MIFIVVAFPCRSKPFSIPCVSSHLPCHLPLQRQEDVRKKAEESFARWKREKARQKKQALQQQHEAEANKVKVVVVSMA